MQRRVVLVKIPCKQRRFYLAGPILAPFALASHHGPGNSTNLSGYPTLQKLVELWLMGGLV